MSLPLTPVLDSKEKRDIDELNHKIGLFKEDKIDEEKFRHFRLTRGVYGQRQQGVQMIRIKIPFGRITADQLKRIADVSDTYATGNLHITTRQNIQYHFVKLEDSPKVWEALSDAGITMREACGNTVRTITASATAGIDAHELFDVSGYAHAAFEYFLRNPICQEMGRKVKIAFSASDKDSAFTYFHDFGFIPRMREEQKGFKVVVGGGLGAQSMVAQTYSEFIRSDKILPFLEAAIRVFDRHGERANRGKARLKFLIKKKGMDTFRELVETELKSLTNQSVIIEEFSTEIPELPGKKHEAIEIKNEQEFNLWRKTNVFKQKQEGNFGVFVRVKLGNISSDTARDVAGIVKEFAADDIRLTINQGFLLKFVKEENLPALYSALQKIDLAAPGFDSTADITACPGTDTCNLGIADSTNIAKYLEGIIQEEYPELIENSDIKIKISGCMNSCGQHMAANIGFHGSSIKKNMRIIPAMNLVLGGGVDPNGEGFVADRIVKIPTKRAPQVLRVLLDDFSENALEGEYFNKYYRRLGKHYFNSLVEPLADTDNVLDDDFIDWGSDQPYFPAIGVGECAGVSYDLVSVILEDAKSRLESAKETFDLKSYSESVYYSYSTFVIAAKAILLVKDIRCNTHIGIINDFQEHYATEEDFNAFRNFKKLVLQINENQPDEKFAVEYLENARDFLKTVIELRNSQLENTKDKLVIENFYKA
jgi:sulfite reductase (ferredoxin)